MRVGDRVMVMINYTNWEEGVILSRGLISRWTRREYKKQWGMGFQSSSDAEKRPYKGYRVYIKSQRVVEVLRSEIRYMGRMSVEEILTFGKDACLLELVRELS